MISVGTVFGTFDQATMTPVDEAIVITWVEGSDETAEAGTITGEDHDDGTPTVDVGA